MPLRRARLASVTAALAVAAGLAPTAASAEPAAGLAGTADLATFDTANPSAVTVRTIGGLQAAETAIGLDRRPATGELMLLTVPTGVVANATVRLYSLDPATASATFVGSILGTVPGAGDVPTGVDFNPVVDRLRVVNASNENFRVNPNNAALSGNDTDLTYTAPAAGPVTAVAYDRNIAPGPPGTLAPPGTLTTLYGIDTGPDRLVTIGGVSGDSSPNGGAVRSEGALGVAVDDGSDAGFDIAANGLAFASLRVAGQPGLYRISLAGGTASLIGALPFDLRELTILGPDNCPAVAGDNQADQDGDGLGDACDSDIDGDGVSNDAETARGSDPRKADSDGDGKPDGTDACPTVASPEANGCVTPPAADTTAAKITIGSTPSRTTRKKFFSGIASRISASEPVSLEIALLGKARSAGLGKTADVVLAEKSYGLSASSRSVKLKPKRSLIGRKKTFKVRLQVIATDAAGNRTTKTKSISVR
jgi:hypothetical protein